MVDTKRLYRLTIPLSSLSEESNQANRNISAQGAITSGVSPVENISVEPGEKRINGRYVGNGASRLARQMNELFESQDIGTVAFFQLNTRTEEDGYYSLGNVNITRAEAKQDKFIQFNGNLTKEGTRQSHYRQMDFTVSLVDNEFGNTDEATIGVPADATRTFWFDTVSGQQQTATPDSTVEAEGTYDLTGTSAVTRDVDLFDANANPYGSDGVLLYDLPYDEEGRTDCGVWDTLDDAGDKITVDSEGNDILNWQRVFVQDHDFIGNPVMENGRISIEFDLSAPGFNTIEEWNSGGGTWDTVSLNASNGWAPIDVDFTEIGEVSVKAQVLFEDSDDGSVYPLDFILTRGADRPIIAVPPNAGSVYGALPTDLETYLTPLANDEQNSPNADLGLIQRSETRL